MQVGQVQIAQLANLFWDACMVVAIEQWNVYVIMDGREHYAKSQFVTSIVLGLMVLAE